MLTKKNIESQINFLFDHYQDFVLVYQDLAKKAIEEHDPIHDDFRPLFIYHLIKNKVDLEQFSNVMSYLYKNSTTSQLGSALNKFFVTDDPNLNLRDYSKLDKNNNNESIWDNMGYLFLDFKEDNPNGKKLALDKNNLPYLLAILNEAEDNTVEALWYAGYHRFIGNFRFNIEPIAPLIKMAEDNTAFQKREEGNYLNFFDTLFREIGNLSYEKEVYPNENKETYKLLSKYVKDIDSLIANTLIRTENQYGEVEIKKDLGLINFCLRVGEVDIIPMIDKKFKELYAETKSNLNGSENQKRFAIQKLLSNFSSTIEVCFKEYGFKLDCSQINTKKKYEENFIYLKLIEKKIKNKQDFSIDKNIAEYIINLFKKPKKSNMLDEFFGIGKMLDEETIIPYLKVHSNYQELEQSLDKKEIKKVKKSKV